MTGASGKAMLMTFFEHSAATTWLTIDPRPPNGACSSTVTTSFVFCAASTTAFLSSGFTQYISMTLALIPSFARISAASTDPNEFYVGMGICHIDLALLIGSGRKKAGRRKSVRLLSTVRHAGCHRNQILLRDPHLHKLVRVGIRKRCHGSRASGITAKHRDLLIHFCMF